MVRVTGTSKKLAFQKGTGPLGTSFKAGKHQVSTLKETLQSPIRGIMFPHLTGAVRLQRVHKEAVNNNRRDRIFIRAGLQARTKPSMRHWFQPSPNDL